MRDDQSTNPEELAHERRYYGRRMVLALFRSRPQDIIQVHLQKKLLEDHEVSSEEAAAFRELLRICAQNRKSYQFVDDDRLFRLSKSKHHEGIVVLAKARLIESEKNFLEALSKKSVNGPIVFLDQVTNPHNIGAIMRSAAHFGCETMLSREWRAGAAIAAATHRISEGGSEMIHAVAVSNEPEVLANLKKAGYIIVSTSTDATHKKVCNLFATNLSAPIVLILGSEKYGVRPALHVQADHVVYVPGTGDIQSLNVSAAAAVILAEAWRQQVKNT